MEFDKWLEEGKQLGLKGAELRTWIVEQQGQAIAREERAWAREEKEKEREEKEKEREEKEKEREENEKEQVAAKEAEEREVLLLQLRIQLIQSGNESRACNEHLELQEEQRKYQVPVEVAHGKFEEVARKVLPMVEREASMCEPKCAVTIDARSVDGGVVVEGPADGDRIERDEILCQLNAREAARPAVEVLAYVANVALAEVVRNDTNVLGKSTSVELNPSEKCAEAQCGQDSAVGDSAQVCELRSAEEITGIVPRCLKLSASEGGIERGDSPANHPDCMVEVASVNDDMRAGHHEARAEGSEISTSKRARRKKRCRRVRNAAVNATQPNNTKGAKPCGERSAGFRKARWPIAMATVRARSNRRVTKQGNSRSARGRTKARGPLCSPSLGSLPRVQGMAHEREPVRHRELVGQVSEVAVRCLRGTLPLCHVSRVGSEENGRCTFCIPSLTKRAVKPRPPRVRLKDMAPID